MQSEGGRLQFHRAGLSFLIAFPRKLSLESFFPLGWVLRDTTFPTKAVLHLARVHHFGSRQEELTPLSPAHLSKDQSLLMSEAHLWVKMFLSLLSLPSSCAGWVLVSSTPRKVTTSRAESWWKCRNLFGRRSSSPAVPFLCYNGRRSHGPLLPLETGWAAPAARDSLGRGRSLKLWAMQLRRTKPWGTAFLQHPEKTAQGHGSLRAKSSHKLRVNE